MVIHIWPCICTHDTVFNHPNTAHVVETTPVMLELHHPITESWTLGLFVVTDNRVCLDFLCAFMSCDYFYTLSCMTVRVVRMWLAVCPAADSSSTSSPPRVVHHKTLQGTGWWLAGTPWELYVYVCVYVCASSGGLVCVVMSSQTQWHVYCICVCLSLCVCFTPSGNVTLQLALSAIMLWICVAAVPQQPPQ